MAGQADVAARACTGMCPPVRLGHWPLQVEGAPQPAGAMRSHMQVQICSLCQCYKSVLWLLLASYWLLPPPRFRLCLSVRRFFPL